MTPLEYLEKQKALIDDINSVLSRHGITESIDLSNITITEKTVSDFVKDNQKLSNMIVDAIWPSIDELTVYHYTSKEAAESILNSGEFRLYSLLKRFTEGEITTFCQNHGLDGYLEQNESGEPKYKSLLMSNMFYASFTDTNITSDQEDYFWRTFASIDGVRLKLNVTASNPNFRKMVYEKTKGNPLPLLSELTGTIKKTSPSSGETKTLSPVIKFLIVTKKILSLLFIARLPSGFYWEITPKQPKGVESLDWGGSIYPVSAIH